VLGGVSNIYLPVTRNRFGLSMTKCYLMDICAYVYIYVRIYLNDVSDWFFGFYCCAPTLASFIFQRDIGQNNNGQIFVGFWIERFFVVIRNAEY